MTKRSVSKLTPKWWAPDNVESISP